jgi:hypothetical protein
MQNITSTVGLKEAIQQLEIKQTAEGQLLKEQFNITYTSLKPVNLIKTFSEAVASPDIISNLISASIGLTAGFFSKRILAKTSGSLLKKVFGSILLFGVTRIIARKPSIIQAIGKFIAQRVPNRKKVVS